MSTTLPKIVSNQLRLIVGVLMLQSALLHGTVVTAQQPAAQTIESAEDGVVTADDVYVRSGPSLNHYTICKLARGTQVSVLGENNGWIEIEPPEPAFSLVSSEFIDTVDKRTGVVNGNNVRVRAGSLLNSNKYTVQTMVSSGFEVQIVGENPDGFLRIKPPAGATLWIHGDFIKTGAEAQAELAVGAESATDAGQPVQADGSPDRDSIVEGGEESGAANAAMQDSSDLSALASIPPTPQRTALRGLDAETERELGKPIYERSFEPILERYRKVAAQTSDAFASAYAKSRLHQIEGFVAVVAGARRMREMDDRAGRKRREFLSARSALRSIKIPTPRGIDAKGELLTSALYPPGSLPRRYRLVDPKSPETRTLGYVELPANSTIDVTPLLGKYVGVRASITRLQGDSVNPVPIFVADELILLDEGGMQAGSSTGGR